MASANRVLRQSLLLDQNLGCGSQGYLLHLNLPLSLDNSTASSASSSSSTAPADNTAPPSRRLIPRSREVSSRYKTTANAASEAFRHRLSSPTFHRVDFCPNDVPSPRRSLSSERRRPTPAVALLEARTSSTASFDGGAMDSGRRAGRSEVTQRWPSSTDSAADLSGADKCLNVSSAKSKRLRAREKPAASCLTPCDPSLKPAPNLIQRSVDIFEKPSVRGKERTLYRRQSSENAKPSENLPSKPDRTSSTCRKLLGAALTKSLDLNIDGNTYKPPSSSTTCKLPRSSADSSGVLNRSINRNTTSCGAAHNLISDHSINRSIASCHSQCRRAARKLTLENGRGDREHPERVQSKVTSMIDNLRDSGLSRTEHGLHHVRRDTGEEAQPACLAARPQEIDFASAVSSSPSRELMAAESSATITTMRGTPPIPFSTEPAQFSSRRLRNRSSTNTCILQRSLSSIDQKLLFEPRGEQPCLWSSTLPRTLSCAHKLPQHSLSPSELKPPNSSTRTWHSVSGSESSMSYSLGSLNNESAVGVYFGAFKGKRKMRITQMEETFSQRVLHNRLLQWSFVNAQAEHVVSMQRAAGEKMLFGVSMKIGDLNNSITRKRIKLQRARHMQTLNSTFKVQGPRLEDWFFLHQDHTNALLDLVEALEASTLKVPVHEGIKADTPAIRKVMDSSVDVIFAVKSSFDVLQPKVEVTKILLTELAQVANQERTLLKECEHLLMTASNLEGEERSLRMHLIQAEQEKARLLGPLLAADSLITSTA